MGHALKFYVFAIRLAIFLALIGQLKSCTYIMMGFAAEKTEAGIMSYSKYSRMLTK